MDYTNFNYFKKFLNDMKSKLETLQNYYPKVNKELINSIFITQEDFIIYFELKNTTLNYVSSDQAKLKEINNIEFFKDHEIEKLLILIEDIEIIFDELDGYENVQLLFNSYDKNIEQICSSKANFDSSYIYEIFKVPLKTISDSNDEFKKNNLDNFLNFNLIEPYPHTKNQIINTLLTCSDSSILKRYFDPTVIEELEVEKHNLSSKKDDKYLDSKHKSLFDTNEILIKEEKVDVEIKSNAEIPKSDSNNIIELLQSKPTKIEKKPHQFKFEPKSIENNKKEDLFDKKIEEDLENEMMGYAKGMKVIAKGFGENISKTNKDLENVRISQEKGLTATKKEMKELDKFNSNDKVTFWLQLKMLIVVLVTFFIHITVIRIFPRFI